MHQSQQQNYILEWAVGSSSLHSPVLLLDNTLGTNISLHYELVTISQAEILEAQTRPRPLHREVRPGERRGGGKQQLDQGQGSPALSKGLPQVTDHL